MAITTLTVGTLENIAEEYSRKASESDEMLCQYRQDLCDLRRHVGINTWQHDENSLTEIAARNRSVAAKYVEVLTQAAAEEERGACYGQLADFYYDLAEKVNEGEVDLSTIAGFAGNQPSV